MNTKKLFDVDINECINHCTLTDEGQQTCDRVTFQLPRFCPQITDECKRDRDACSCWRLVRSRISFATIRIRGVELGDDTARAQVTCEIESGIARGKNQD